MKKLIFILSLLGLTFAGANAQNEAEGELMQRRYTPTQQKKETGKAGGRVVRPEKGSNSFELSVGPRVGIGLTTMSDNKDLSIANGVGFAFDAGVGLNMRFGGKDSQGRPIDGKGLFGVGLELNYALRTAPTKGDKGLSLSYFDIPLLLQIYPAYTTRELRNLYVEVGPTFSPLISSGPKEMKKDNIFYGTGDFKGGDIKMTFGLGYRFNRADANSGFYMNFRYNLGTSNLAGNFPAKISTAELTFGYLFKCAGGAKSQKKTKTDNTKKDINKIRF